MHAHLQELRVSFHIQNVCTIAKSVCNCIQKMCILFIITYLEILIKISPLQYQNDFYAPAWKGMSEGDWI